MKMNVKIWVNGEEKKNTDKESCYNFKKNEGIVEKEDKQLKYTLTWFNYRKRKGGEKDKGIIVGNWI